MDSKIILDTVNLNFSRQPHLRESFLIDFKANPYNHSGCLVAADEQIPFLVRRNYWIQGIPEGITKGLHAHKNTHEVLVAMRGKIRIELENLKGEKSLFILDTPDKGLYVPPMTWLSVDYQEDSILLAMASTTYHPSDYISDYQIFKNLSLPLAVPSVSQN
jgi:dTDP-4-dehydrorhamnose 3,5-epimerase-like enzyme